MYSKLVSLWTWLYRLSIENGSLDLFKSTFAAAAHTLVFFISTMIYTTELCVTTYSSLVIYTAGE